jgi:spermidine synthase
MDASYIDLADAKHLEFDYIRWLRIVLRAAGARRVLHIGGGACALARALAAEDPGSRQMVCEVDAAVLALAREHLGLRRVPGLRVRHAEGRAYIAAQPDSHWDAIVIDAFVGARIPATLITVEAFREFARVAPMTLINVVDNRAARDVNAIVSSAALAYPRIWTLGGHAGNTIVVGSTQTGEPDLIRVASQAAADVSPARISSSQHIRRILASAAPLHDRVEPSFSSRRL